jgi:hypothetical protein
MNTPYEEVLQQLAKDNKKRFDEAQKKVEEEKRAKNEHTQQILADEQVLLANKRQAEEQKRLDQKKASKNQKLQALINALMAELNDDDEGHAPLDKIV